MVSSAPCRFDKCSDVDAALEARWVDTLREIPGSILHYNPVSSRYYSHSKNMPRQPVSQYYPIKILTWCFALGLLMFTIPTVENWSAPLQVHCGSWVILFLDQKEGQPKNRFIHTVELWRLQVKPALGRVKHWHFVILLFRSLLLFRSGQNIKR